MEEREERANEPEDRTVEINLNNREKQAGEKKKANSLRELWVYNKS